MIGVDGSCEMAVRNLRGCSMSCPQDMPRRSFRERSSFLQFFPICCAFGQIQQQIYTSLHSSIGKSEARQDCKYMIFCRYRQVWFCEKKYPHRSIITAAVGICMDIVWLRIVILKLQQLRCCRTHGCIGQELHHLPYIPRYRHCRYQSHQVYMSYHRCNDSQ